MCLCPVRVQLPSSRILSRTSGKGRFRQFDCGSTNDGFWCTGDNTCCSDVKLSRTVQENTRPQIEPYLRCKLAQNPGSIPRPALQICFCAVRQSYQNVSRETLLSD